MGSAHEVFVLAVLHLIEALHKRFLDQVLQELVIRESRKDEPAPPRISRNPEGIRAPH